MLWWKNFVSLNSCMDILLSFWPTRWESLWNKLVRSKFFRFNLYSFFTDGGVGGEGKKPKTLLFSLSGRTVTPLKAFNCSSLLFNLRYFQHSAATFVYQRGSKAAIQSVSLPTDGSRSIIHSIISLCQPICQLWSHKLQHPKILSVHASSLLFKKHILKIFISININKNLHLALPTVKFLLFHHKSLMVVMDCHNHGD